MKLQTIVPAAVLGLVMTAGLPAATAQEAQQVEPLPVETVDGTSYISGGVGEMERAALRKQAKDFPLHMTFATGRGSQLLPGVEVSIVDKRGKPMLELEKAGPMLYVKMPNGSYKVTARHGDVTQTRQVTLAPGKPKSLNFFW